LDGATARFCCILMCLLSPDDGTERSWLLPCADVAVYTGCSSSEMLLRGLFTLVLTL